MIRHPDVLPLPFQFRARSVPVQFHGYHADDAYWFRAFNEQEQASRVHAPSLPACGLTEPGEIDLFSIDRLLNDDRFYLEDVECDEDGNKPHVPTFACVSVYLCDRAFGGHEEGGWWFDYGEPCTGEAELAAKLMVFTHQRDAYEYRDQLQKYLDEQWNAGRRPIESVLSEGIYRAVVDIGRHPAPYPTHTPHYE